MIIPLLAFHLQVDGPIYSHTGLLSDERVTRKVDLPLSFENRSYHWDHGTSQGLVEPAAAVDAASAWRQSGWHREMAAGSLGLERRWLGVTAFAAGCSELAVAAASEEQLGRPGLADFTSGPG